MTMTPSVPRRLRVLFCAPQLTDFFLADFDALKSAFEVEHCDTTRLPLRPRAMGPLIRHLKGADCAVIWFASTASWKIVLLSRLLGVKTILIGGGVDVAKIPALQFGAFLHWRSALYSILSYRLSNLNLYFSNQSREDLRTHSGISRGEVLYLGADVDIFKPAAMKKDWIVTVGSLSKSRLRQKGYLQLRETARLLPNLQFHLIGDDLDGSLAELMRAAPPNFHVHNLGYNPHRIAEFVGQCKVYAQLSHYEGFGRAMVEGMAAGCVPVVTRCGAIPEVVGDTGVYVPCDDPAATAEGVRRALGMSAEPARLRARTLYSQSLRDTRLVETVRRVCGSRPGIPGGATSLARP